MFPNFGLLMIAWFMMPRFMPVDMRRIREGRMVLWGETLSMMKEVALSAEENIMLEGMRYWYVQASSLGRWKERMRWIWPRWGEPSGGGSV